MVPLAVADIGAVFEERIFATDASDSKGTITMTRVPSYVSAALRRSCKTKGDYTRLKTNYEISWIDWA